MNCYAITSRLECGGRRGLDEAQCTLMEPKNSWTTKTSSGTVTAEEVWRCFKTLLTRSRIWWHINAHTLSWRPFIQTAYRRVIHLYQRRLKTNFHSLLNCAFSFWSHKIKDFEDKCIYFKPFPQHKSNKCTKVTDCPLPLMSFRGHVLQKSLTCLHTLKSFRIKCMWWSNKGSVHSAAWSCVSWKW